MGNDKVQKKLESLRKDFYKKLPERFAKLEQLWQEISLSFNKNKFHEFYRETHSLTGLSGTFGNSIISQKIRDLEVYLDQLQEANNLNAIQHSEISHLVDGVKDAITSDNKGNFKATKPVDIPIDSYRIVFINGEVNSFQKELKSHLEKLGFNFIFYKNIDSFLKDHKKKLPVAIIIEDNFLRNEDTKKLGFLNQTYQIPFVCISKNKDIETRLHAIRVGVSLFLSQPLDIYYLTNRLIQICDIAVNKNFRILILDDNESLARYYALILKESGMITKVISDASQLMDALHDFNPNVLLLDLYIPGCNGLELTKIIRQEERYASLPIIFISTETDRYKQLSILNSCGGDDFLTKPVLPQNLISAVKSRALRSAMLVNYLRHDSLTGLLNHSYILAQLDFEILRAQRLKKPISVAMIDIDNFKEINDKFGHPIGDISLIKTAEFLSSNLRQSDYIGRYGGDEFAIIFPEANSKDAKKICKKICNEISEKFFFEEGKNFKITLSVGIACYPEYSTAHKLIEAGDRALYLAKSKGKNRVEVSKGD